MTEAVGILTFSALLAYLLWTRVAFTSNMRRIFALRKRHKEMVAKILLFSKEEPSWERSDQMRSIVKEFMDLSIDTTNAINDMEDKRMMPHVIGNFLNLKDDADRANKVFNEQMDRWDEFYSHPRM